MPPYTAKVVSDQQAADIFAYLQSLPKPPAVENVPLLKE
jgi:mono/diheme cytochrome c family protein